MKRILGLLLIGMMVASAGFGQKKMEDITIRFFAGGDAGDPFASIVYKGAMAAQKALGVQGRVRLLGVEQREDGGAAP